MNFDKNEKLKNDKYFLAWPMIWKAYHTVDNLIVVFFNSIDSNHSFVFVLILSMQSQDCLQTMKIILQAMQYTDVCLSWWFGLKFILAKCSP